MHFEDSDGSLFSIRSNPKSQSRMDFGMKGSIPRFSHHPADLTKKSILTTNIPKTTQAQYSSTRPGVLSKIDLNSLSNLSLSPKNEKHERPYRSKEVAPKVLNMSHDADNPNPGPETEGDSSIVRHNHSRNEIRVMDQPIFEDIDVNHSPVSRSRRNLENGNDSSRFYFFNQNSMHQVRGPSHIDLAQDLHQSQPIIIDNPVHPGHPVQVVQVEQRIEIPERHVADQAQEVTPEQAAEWQHELSIRANHKFRVLQWSVIFVVLASLIGYASITGETPATVLYVILILTAILQIYSILRFCNRKLLRSRKGLNKILKLSDWIFLIAYSVGTLIKIQKPETYTVFYLTPLPLSVFIRLLFIRKKTSILRIILWLQVVVFTLKIDNILTINWLLIFVIAFGFSAGFIIRIFYLIYKIKNKRDLAKELPEENHLRLLRMKMLGLGWDILVSSYSIIMVLFFYGLAEKLENTQNGNIMGATLLVAMVYSIFILYLTLKFKYEITRSIITKIIRNDKDHIKMKEILQKELEVGISSKSIPKQLVRVSATYYQVVTSESKAKTEKGENKSKPTFITVGDLAANANIEEEKEEDNNKADSQNENEHEEIQEKEEEEEEEEEEEKEDPDEKLPKTKNKKSGNRFRLLFRKRRVSKHSYSESDMPQDVDEEEESPSSQIKSEEDAQDEDPHCFVCCDRIANTVIMNCGHGGLCYQCGLDMWKKEEKCYLCRQKISKLLRLNKDHEYTDTPGVQIATTLNKDRKINVNDSFQDILNDI